MMLNMFLDALGFNETNTAFANHYFSAVLIQSVGDRIAELGLT